MGGTVGVTIRRPDGQVIKMARKTGSYKHLFLSEGWLDKDYDKAIEDYCKLFFEMKNDFEANKDTKNYKFNMSPVYGWCNECAPIDYGLVVIDFQSKKIHTMQDYDSTRVAQESLVFFKNLEPQLIEKALKTNGWNIIDEDENCWSINEFFGSNDPKKCVEKLEIAYSHVKQTLNKIIGKTKFPADKITYETIAQISVIPKNLDFEIISYERNISGALELFKNLKKDGFVFNTDENQMWKDFMQDNLIEYLECLEADQDLSEAEYEKFVDEKEKSLKKEIKTLFDDPKSSKLKKK